MQQAGKGGTPPRRPTALGLVSLAPSFPLSPRTFLILVATSDLRALLNSLALSARRTRCTAFCLANTTSGVARTGAGPRAGATAAPRLARVEDRPRRPKEAVTACM